MDFIRITLDTTQDIGAYIVERFSTLHTVDYNRGNYTTLVGKSVLEESECYDSLIYRNQRLMKRENVWTFQEGTFSAEPQTWEVRCLKTRFIMPQENDGLLPVGATITLEPIQDNIPFRSFTDVIRGRARGDLYYKRPETFDWTDKAAAVYKVLSDSSVLLSINLIAIKLHDHFRLHNDDITDKDIKGMLEEMSGVGLVKQTPDGLWEGV